jgi:adenine-specific DNA methylase
MAGDFPQQKWSVNFTSIQMFAWMIAKLVALVIGMWAGISFVADYQFKRSLDEFHNIAQPEIERMVDEKIDIHKAIAEAPMIERLHKIENQAGQYDERLKALKENSDRNTIELRDANQKLDRILERLADR